MLQPEFPHPGGRGHGGLLVVVRGGEAEIPRLHPRQNLRPEQFLLRLRPQTFGDGSENLVILLEI